MRNAAATAIAGMSATVLGLLALIANEGAFFSGETEAINLNVSAFDCAEGGADDVLKLGVGEAGFFDARADLVMELDLAAYAARGCAHVEIVPRREVVFELTGGAYDWTDHRFIYVNPARPDELSRTPCDCVRLLDADAPPGVLRAILPGALNRVAPDAYSVRVGVGGVGETPILGAYGVAGYVAKDGWDHDVTFQLQRFTRVVSMTSILFATLLGIGVGALFEAALSFATSRRLDAFSADLEAREGRVRSDEDAR